MIFFGRGVMMSKMVAMIVMGSLVLAGCSGVGASNSDELASDAWVTQRVNEVKKDADSLESRMATLDREIKQLQDKNGGAGDSGDAGSGSGSEKPTDPHALFTDITSNFFAYNEIKFLSERGVISGYPDGSFAPNQTITRAQTAVMLVRELGLTAPESYEMKATDVSKNSSAYNSIRIAEYHGLMRGTDGKINPGNGLTRSQMAVVLTRAFKLEKPTEQYPFADITSEFPNYDQINTIAHHGITTEIGKPFRPNEVTTRAQFSLFMARTIHEPFRP